MRISDWSSDVCSSDLAPCGSPGLGVGFKGVRRTMAGWSRHRGGRPVPEAPPVIGDGRGSTMRLLWISAHPQPTRALIAGDLPAGSGGGAALSGAATAVPDFFPRPGHPTRPHRKNVV